MDDLESIPAARHNGRNPDSSLVLGHNVTDSHLASPTQLCKRLLVPLGAENVSKSGVWWTEYNRHGWSMGNASPNHSTDLSTRL